MDYRLRLAVLSESASTPSPWTDSMAFLIPESAILKMLIMSLFQLDSQGRAGDVLSNRKPLLLAGVRFSIRR